MALLSGVHVPGVSLPNSLPYYILENNARETKKASGKFLLVWAKNQVRLNIFEKNFNFPYANLNGRLTFTNFLSNLPRPLPFMQLWKKLHFLQQFFFGFSGSFPTGAPVLISELICHCCAFIKKARFDQ